uniref:DBF4-type domain-containing protein n=1 Tax=Romanomermis culicivorax TaxID=13658 RepID=A0A915I6R8_ROMCU
MEDSAVVETTSVVAVMEKVYAVVTDDPSFVKYVLEKRQTSTSNSNSNNFGGSSFFAQRSSGAADSSSNLQLLTSKERLNRYFQKMPSVLRQAYDLQLKIVTSNQFRAQLTEIENNLKSHCKFKSPQISSLSFKKDVKNSAPVRLQAPFLKFEDKMQIFSPVFKEFVKEPWPRIVIRPNGRGCPFERKFNNEEEEKAPKKEIDLKPRLTARKNNQNGFCELCQSWAENLEMHVKGPSHRKNACSDSKYAAFDALVSQGPTLSDFLSNIRNCNNQNSQKLTEVQAGTSLVQNDDLNCKT